MGFSLICICPGSYVNRLTCRPGQNPLSRSAISACFREPGHSGFLNSYRLADGIGGIRPILELARCPGFRINRLTFIPGQQKLSRFAKIARNREPGQRILSRFARQTVDMWTGTSQWHGDTADALNCTVSRTVSSLFHSHKVNLPLISIFCKSNKHPRSTFLRFGKSRILLFLARETTEIPLSII